MRKVVWVAIFSIISAIFPQAHAESSLGSQIAEKAWNELQKNSPKSYSKVAPNVSFVVAPNSDPKKVKIAENQMIFMLHYYEKYIPAKTPITIWIWDAQKDIFLAFLGSILATTIVSFVKKTFNLKEK